MSEVKTESRINGLADAYERKAAMKALAADPQFTSTTNSKALLAEAAHLYLAASALRSRLALSGTRDMDDAR